MESHFERIAIVNQGEAAIRLIQAIRELNRERQLSLSTVALFTESDRQAMFVREADDAVCIGPPTFLDQRDGQRRSSYLDPERIEQALIIAHADGAWVGWSRLAEEAWFADLCKRLGIVFVGPNAETLRLLGNKISVRQLAQQANIPVDPTVSLERMIDGAHHIEVQVIADTFGTTWAVGVHDCTVQRHGQKILEESRSPVLLPEQERELREAAVRLCQLANYRSAGSVEFLYDSGKREFWFQQFNSCLSATHPVTEVTTGLDLVKLQLDLARGGRLVGEPPASTCHAIEIHLYAEDMDNSFAPGSGRLELFRLANGPGIRIDTGYEEGNIVPVEFGTKLAQITAWGRDRREALARLSRALVESTVVIRARMSNKSFLLDLLDRPEIATSEVDTFLLDRLIRGEAQRPRQYAGVALLQAAVEAYNTEQRLSEAEFYASAAHGRPRVRQSADFPTHFQYRGLVYKLKVSRLSPQQYRVTMSGQSIEVRVERLGVFERWLTCFGRRYRVLSLVDGPDCYVEVEGIPHRITHEEGGLVRSPAPAVVVSVTVTPGDRVNAGDQLAFVETMKMEMAITAPFPGTVVQVFVTSNVQVDMGAPLIHIEPSEWVDTSADTEPIQFVDAAHTVETLAPIRPANAAGAAELSRSDNEASASTAAQSVRTSGVRFAQAGREENEDTLQVRCRRIFEALRCQILGYDIDPTDSKQLLSDQSTVYHLIKPDNQELLQDENEILSIFADICSLFRRELDPAEANAQGEQVHSVEQDLLTYLRSRDTLVERLPNTFLASLQRALAHYGVKSLEPSPELDASLLLMYKSHEHINQQLAAIIAILQRRLEHADTLAFSASGEMHILLDRLLLATQGRYPAVNDLAREIRFRYFNKPLFERARNKVYEEMQVHLAYLAGYPAASDRDERMSILVACPQPLQNLLTSRFPQSEDEMRQLMLEVLTRRYYRIRKLEDFECTTADGQTFVKAAYQYEGARIIVVTTYARYEDLAVADIAMSRFVKQFPDEHDVVVDFYLWRSTSLGDAEATEQEVHMILNKTNFPRHLRRIVVAVSAPGKGLGITSTQHFTYSPGENDYQEDRLYRGLHPMMGERLHIWRLANFQIERLPSAEDVYLFHGTAIDNPKDERLFALAEVRDMSPLRDESGKILQIPHLERMLMEALESIRLYQSHLPIHKRLPWNRVLLYVWPPLGLLSEELLELMRKLWPATEGLGLERIVVHAKIAEPETRELRSRMLHISNPGGRELVLRESVPIETPIATLSEYRQKVVQLRQRGLVYPYEIIEMLTPEPEGTRTLIPPGNFTEYDLDEDNQLVPIDRPYGENGAGIVVGIIRNYTPRYPEGMTRVILLGDPSHSLGSVAEPECRRIIEAINLAERLQVPLEWFTFSAGARISMESGTENMDWVARTLRRIIEFTQVGGEINVIVNGINVGAQPYWNAEATMLMHTHGILYHDA